MLKRILKNQIENKSLFHSYIFEGNKEDARNQYREFAKEAINTNIDIDNLLEIISTDKKSISINIIRELTKNVFEAPSGFDYRIIVIEDAHLMRNEAQNALLKTLEELPSYSIIIMTTNNRYKLLNTIISRSQVISLKQSSVNFDKDLFKSVISIVQKALLGNYYIISKEKSTFKELSERKEETLLIFTYIFSELLLKRQEIDGYSVNNSYLGKNSIEKILLKIEDFKSLLKVNINFQIIMEDLLFTIIEENVKNKKLMDMNNDKN